MLKSIAKWLERKCFIITNQNVMKQQSDSKIVNKYTELSATVDLNTWVIDKIRVFHLGN